ncbi:MAG: insulinase family protein [Candidatus Rokubacteria bacterium]|nr:insulinase family protein [Candidatus Rokubacteria bacterium]
MTRARVVGLVVAMLLVAPIATRGAEAPDVTRHVLPNGLTLLVRESRAAAVVAVSLQVDGGSAFETPETAGISQLVQRVMVRGTARRSMMQLAEAAEEIGGAIDASADVEHAELQGHALARRWETLLGLVAEVALDPAFKAEEIERARRLLVSQAHTRADTPRAFAMEALLRDLYGPHPYGIPPGGRPDTLAAISREALVAHYRRMYRPDRMVLAVSGNVPRDRVVKQAANLFRRLERGVPHEPAALAAPAPTRGRRTVERPAQQAQIVMGALGPAVRDPDYAAVKVLAAVLGGGTAGRFFAELRDRRGLAYTTGVINASRRGPSAFVGYIGTTAINVEAAESGMRGELDRIRAEPPTADELDRAKAYVLGALAMDRRTNARQAWYLAFFELIGAGWDFPDRYARAVGAVTADAVHAAAQRYLDRPTTFVLIPR